MRVLGECNSSKLMSEPANASLAATPTSSSASTTTAILAVEYNFSPKPALSIFASNAALIGVAL
jgi:hypothetical protein